MSKFVSLMKNKIFWIFSVCGLCAIIGISYFIFTNISNPTKYSADLITTNMSAETFRSGQKANGEYDTYTISFFSETKFEYAMVEYSFNVKPSITKTSNLVEITFIIEQGNNFTILLTTENFEDKKLSLPCQPYIQDVRLKFDLFDAENQTYELSETGDSYYKNLYLTAPENYELAIKEKFPSQVDFDIVSNVSDHEQNCIVIVNKPTVARVENNTITPLEADTFVITIKATEGSRFQKNFYFRINETPIASLSGLPSVVNIDLDKTNTFVLKNYNITPSYSNLNLLNFDNMNVVCDSMVLTVRVAGSHQCKFVFEGNILHTFTVIATKSTPVTPPTDPDDDDDDQDDDNGDDNPGNDNPPQKSFVIGLGENSNSNIVFDEKQNLFTLKLSDFSNQIAILKLSIKLDDELASNYNFNTPVEFSDPNNILLEYSEHLGNTGLTLVLNKIGSLTFEIKHSELNLSTIISIVVS